MRRHPSSFGLVLLAAGMLACAPALAASEIGVTSAVVPAARGTPVDAEARVLRVGLDMQANERVQTDAGGKAHLLFLDGSALSIGPNSDVVLDEYVYDPDSRTGKIALSATRGVFRLVGGAISKTTPVTLRTPQATIGVRGGIAMITAGPDGVEAGFVYGQELFVEGGGETQRVERPGFSIATGPGGTPQPPQPLTQQSVDRQNAAFEGGDAPPPGAPPVSDEDVAGTQISTLNSVAEISNMAPAAGGGGGPLSVPPPPDETTEPSQNQATDAAAVKACAAGGSTDPACTDDDRVPDGAAGAGGGQGGAGGGGGAGAGAVTIIVGGGSPAQPALTLGFVGRAKHASNPATGTDDESPTNNVPLASGTLSRSAFTAQVGVQFFGPESFSINAANGAFPATSTQQPFGAGVLTGNGFLTAEEDFLLYTLIDQADGHKVLAFAGIPTPPAAVPTTGVWRYALQDDFVRGQTLPFIEDPSGGLVSLPSAYIAWDDSAGPPAVRAFGAGAISILGQGASQQSAGTVLTGVVLDDADGRPFILGRMNGQRRTGASGASDPTTVFFSHLSTSDAADGSDFFGTTGPRNFVLEASRVDLQDGIQDRGGLRFANAGNNTATDYFPNTPALLGGPYAAGARSARNMNGFANALESRYDIAGNFVSAQRLGMFDDPISLLDVLISTVPAQNHVGATFQLYASQDGDDVDINFGVTSFGADAFIDDQTFMALTDGTVSVENEPVSGLLAMVTSSELQHDGLLPTGVSFCDCDYLTWGFFFGRRESAGGENRVVELGTWVVGELSDFSSQIASVSSMTATYSGHVIAGVNNNGSIYNAVGGISLQMSFGSGAFSLDSVTISNFDGMTISGGGSGSLTSNFYSTSLSGPGVSGTLYGAFFGPGAPPLNTGGTVDLLGTTYRAHGTYAASLPPPSP